MACQASNETYDHDWQFTVSLICFFTISLKYNYMYNFNTSISNFLYVVKQIKIISKGIISLNLVWVCATYKNDNLP